MIPNFAYSLMLLNFFCNRIESKPIGFDDVSEKQKKDITKEKKKVLCLSVRELLRIEPTRLCESCGDSVVSI